MKRTFHGMVMVGLLLWLNACTRTMPENDIVLPPEPARDSAELPIVPAVLLVKTVEKDTSAGIDSTVTSYTYDENARLLARSSIFYQNSAAPARIVRTGDRYYRDALGRIIKIASLVADDLGPVVDSVYKYVHYQHSTGTKVDYMLSVGTYYDSLVFVYDNMDRLWYWLVYYAQEYPANQPKLQSRNVWTYGIGLTRTHFDWYQVMNNPDSLEHIYRYDFEYDDKRNPIFCNDDSRIPDEWLAPHNITHFSSYPLPSGRPSEYNYIYEYRPDGLPLKMYSGDKVQYYYYTDD